MNPLRSQMEEHKLALQELRSVYIDTARKFFNNGAKDLFADYPELYSFGWTQYTPYFNDGDLCEFGARTDDPWINGKSPYDDDDDNEDLSEELENINEMLADTNKRQFYNLTALKRRKEELEQLIGGEVSEEAQQAVAAFLELFDEEVYKDLFGDHVKVTIKKDGTNDVEEYQHD